MSNNTSAYRKIFKSTSLFGLVQVSTIVISTVRHKFLAILIGPAGYGVFNLLTSTVDIVRQITGFSLDTSGVKKISESASVNDEKGVERNVSLLLKLSVLTGIAGMLAVLILSPFLSKWTFGNYDKTLAFVLISVSVLFKQITGSQIAVMQGLSRLKNIAKTNLFGNLIGLIISLPLFYFFRIDAIVPTIILSSAISMLASLFFYKKTGITTYSLTIRESFKDGREILFFGGLLSISSFLPLLSNYLIQLYINMDGGFVKVGLFNVGMLIVNSYVGIIFNAMGTDYYPRLSGMGKDSKKTGEAVNQQAILSMLIIIPIIILFLACSGFIIRLLFSKSFEGSIEMTSWLITAMFFKAVSWSMGYVIIARADSKVFVKTAIIFNILYLFLCLGGYYLKGLEGLAVGFLIYYIVHLMTMFAILYYRYGIRMSRELSRIFILGSIICMGGIFVYQFIQGPFRLGGFIFLILLAFGFSYLEIDKRVDLKSIFINLRNKIKK